MVARGGVCASREATSAYTTTGVSSLAIFIGNPLMQRTFIASTSRTSHAHEQRTGAGLAWLKSVSDEAQSGTGDAPRRQHWRTRARLLPRRPQQSRMLVASSRYVVATRLGSQSCEL